MANNPTELASVFSKVQYVSKGVATIIGPTLSGLLVAYNWRFSYLVSSLLCAVNLFVCVPKLVQRVPPPKPGACFSFKAANPFSFVALFRPSSDYNQECSGSAKGDMAKLALVCGIQYVSRPSHDSHMDRDLTAAVVSTGRAPPRACPILNFRS